MMLSECSLQTLRDITKISASFATKEFGISQFQLRHELDRRKRMSDYIEDIIKTTELASGETSEYRHTLHTMIGWYVAIKDE